MRGARRSISWLAIVAIALHGVLLGLAPLAATAADPFAVICHGAPQAVTPADSAPANRDLVPATACEHCNLCSATAAPGALDDVLVGQLAPAALLAVLHPVSIPPRTAFAFTPNLARGPPAFA